MPVTPEQAAAAVRTLLEYIGDDPDRPGLLETPQRVIRAWANEWGRAYHAHPDELLKLFPYEGTAPHSQVVIVRNIAFHSHCEHHLAPFFGSADVGYIPHVRGLVGLSKLARVVDHFARRLQVQERLTGEIAHFLADYLSPDIAVVVRATHLCMVSRGVQQPGSQTVTSTMLGEFLTDAATRAEFLRLCSPAA